MEMDKLVALCKRRGFLFQSSEIYGGLNGFWDYGPMGVELKRNIKDAWWRDMVSGHDDLAPPPGAPEAYEMTGLDCTIIMHPQVWKCSGHYDLFHDTMVDCRESKKRYRIDQMRGRWVAVKLPGGEGGLAAEKAAEVEQLGRLFIVSDAESPEAAVEDTVTRACQVLGIRKKKADDAFTWETSAVVGIDAKVDRSRVLAPHATWFGTLTEPREFNLMFSTQVGAAASDDARAFLRPETAQGIFVNFKNVLDSTRVRIPFGIAQIGKSFRNEITPRNFTFRSREFEQMEIEFFCHPESSFQWYQYWRDRRMKWYTDLGLAGARLRLREHHADELSHYSTGTADIEYAFPFLPEGDFGELEGIAHRGDFDLRSHMEGKLDPKTRPLQLELGPDGKPRHRGSGKDLSYLDQLTNKRYIPHVIEPSAGADRATLAFLCEAYCEDQAPDDGGQMQTRVVMKFHPRIAPIKAAILPLVKKDGMPEMAQDLYRALKRHCNVFYDEKQSIGKRYRRQDEVGTPYCLTVDGQSLQDGTVTLRDRDSLKQWRLKADEALTEIRQRIQ